MIMLRKVVGIMILALFLQSCSKVPVTGRKQVNLLPESTLMDMSLTNYREFLSQNPAVGSGHVNGDMVKRVGNKMASAVEKYLKKKGLSKRIKDYKWEFNLVNDNTVNAWAMPGGKVVVYSGIMSVAQDETGLAVIMGHEIAHAIARHGNERMSQQLLLQAGGLGLAVALDQKPALTRDLFLLSYGVGTSIGSLKFSRDHELEADKMGLVFMALAGYDPEAAVGFWQRMAAQGGAKPPEFLSTHPSDERRIKDIKAFLPEAKKYYNPS